MGRRKIWIDREIQLKSVLYVLLFLVLTSIFVSLATFNNVWSMLVVSYINKVNNLYFS